MPRKTITMLEAEIKTLQKEIQELKKKIPPDLEEGACYYDPHNHILLIYDGMSGTGIYVFNSEALEYDEEDVSDLILKVHVNGDVVKD